jgi:hypothetical protein
MDSECWVHLPSPRHGGVCCFKLFSSFAAPYGVQCSRVSRLDFLRHMQWLASTVEIRLILEHRHANTGHRLAEAAVWPDELLCHALGLASHFHVFAGRAYEHDRIGSNRRNRFGRLWSFKLLVDQLWRCQSIEVLELFPLQRRGGSGDRVLNNNMHVCMLCVQHMNTKRDAVRGQTDTHACKLTFISGLTNLGRLLFWAGCASSLSRLMF